ncbi:MAG: DUF1622 domain-containing protein [Betaproteobacteria bacterium]|nr:MAG: DUF1622 domain-containing protein [Betaproteobacteria bacterium]
MHDVMTGPVHMVIVILELAAAALLILGFVLATVFWFRRVLRGDSGARHSYRRALGRVTLIGLDVLVAATIVKTITLEPTAESMGLLVFMVAIRVAMTWTTSLEINGRWPWQRSR